MLPFTFLLSQGTPRVPGILLVIFVLLAGCASRASLLEPTTESSGVDPGGKQILVDVRPIDTYGFGSKERKRLGVDLSATFSVFEVVVRNRTDRVVQVYPHASRLQVDLENVFQALTKDERQRYYRTGGGKEGRVGLIPKSARVTKRELWRIEDLAFKDRELKPGEDAKGLIYFKKVRRKTCREVFLLLDGIILSGEDHPRPFRFQFHCPPR